VHFVTGGAFNGKKAWVKKTYGNHYWVSAYKNDLLPTDLSKIEDDLIILEGLEIWLKKISAKVEWHQCLEVWNQHVDNWLGWENAEPNRTLITIGTDISKGIVPMEREYRLWRDLTGWAYQDLAAKAESVDVIWYGFNQTIKKRGND
jgi:adenosyl cobinamide kinase/adenosyl cobinamide phosphate guanylyltransferase